MNRNVFHGHFERNEINSLNSLVAGFTFWNQRGKYYAQSPRTPDQRFVASSLHDLYMQIVTAVNAGKI